ncbi:ABC transporter substrate-binding protein [Streptomyces sp. TRM49041]|uniref:ABC transporter substrate-binding protein n=1 Tax=Streptomyces sp. TRM49041 TaxID=2603216 RepID=UPI0011EE727D|nr:ABC transporter substrate-binding protein [Streptomyces sp. TRM49041]
MRRNRAPIGGLLATALIFAASVGACSSGNQGGSDGRGPLTMVASADPSGYTRGVLAEWNRTHPTEKVTLLQFPWSSDEARAQMASHLRSGSDRFDVLDLDVAWTVEFAAAGWLARLNADRFPIKEFLPPVVNTATLDGELYSLPYITNAGMLYYRKDILDRAGERPPRTWAELEHLAKTVAPKYGLQGYAGQFLPYEGLTVNATEAVQSAGGSILSDDGTRVTVDSEKTRKALAFLADGVRDGWIPREALTYKEEESRKAFQDGNLLFLRNWAYVYPLASGKDSKVAGKFDVAPLPGLNESAVGVLGGSNLAINENSPNKASATDLLAYLTSEKVQRRMLTEGGLAPVRADVYEDPSLVRRFPYLPTLRDSVLAAQPRPKSTQYEQVSSVIQAVVHDTLAQRETPEDAVERLTRELNAIVERD